MSESSLSFRLAQLMREHRFNEAIALSRAHLADHPEDLETLLRLGICYLLNRAEDEFTKVHARASILVSRVGELSGRSAQLWQLHQRLLARLTTPLLVAGSTSLAACNKTPPPESVPSASLPVTSQTPTTTQSEPTSEPPSPSSSATSTAVPKEQPKASAHRYSAGVYRPPSPASHHKYSAGVYRH